MISPFTPCMVISPDTIPALAVLWGTGRARDDQERKAQMTSFPTKQMRKCNGKECEKVNTPGDQLESCKRLFQ
jgi:hypothetical protein